MLLTGLIFVSDLEILVCSSLLFSYLFSMLLKPCVFKKGINLFNSNSELILNSSIWDWIGTSFLSVTNDLDNIAWSANSNKFSLLLFCFISEALFNNWSRSPYSLINSAAVLIPIPGTPGMLSLVSPARDWTSITLLG